MRPVDQVLARLPEAKPCGRRTWKACCPGHDDQKPSLHISEATDGRVLMLCRGGCSTITVLQALGLTWRDLFPGNPRGRFLASPVPHCREEPVLPIPDKARLTRLLDHAHKSLHDCKEVTEKWLPRRGISLQTAEAYGLGFVQRVKFAGWAREVINSWVIPVTDGLGEVRAVKLHREEPEAGSPKGLWAPLGTARDPISGKLRHGYATLYPPPEPYRADWEERAAVREFEAGLARDGAELFASGDCPWLYLCGGELKALAVVGAGHWATSVTTGESFTWTPGTTQRLANLRLCIVYDDDPAGHRFREASLVALQGVAADLKAITFGRKE